MSRRLMLKNAPQAGADYITDGLILWLDGIKNTSGGHNSSASQWEDLSGNGHNYIYNTSNTIGVDHMTTNSKGGYIATPFSDAEVALMKASTRTVELVIGITNTAQSSCILPLGNASYSLTYLKSSGVISMNTYRGGSMPLSAGVHYYNSSYWVDGVQQTPSSEYDTWGTIKKNLLFCYQHETAIHSTAMSMLSASTAER